MSEKIKYGWLTDFDDKKFAPKSLFDYIYTSTTDKRNLTQWLLEFETALNDRDLQVDLASDKSVKFSSPGAIGVTGTLGVNYGGLGIKNPTQHGLLMGNGTDAVSTIDSKAGFLISKTDGTKPLYSGIKALWESLQPDSQGPGFYIGFDNGDKRYYMGEVPLAASNQAGAVSTGAQTFEGAKTFNAATAFKSDVTMEGALGVKNNVTIQNGQLLFGNGSGVGQDHNDKIFITDKDDRAIFYVDAAGIKSVEYHIKNGVYDTNLSTVIGRVGALEDRATDIETDLAQEVADRKDSVLYVALGTASKTTQLKNQAIGVDGVLAVTNGGTGLNKITKNAVMIGNDTSTVALVGAEKGFFMNSSTTGQPHYSSIYGFWESTSQDTQGPTFYIDFDVNGKSYNMGQVPLASKTSAGTISTGTQEINGSKTFLSDTQFSGKVSITGATTVSSKASFLSDIDIAGAAKVNNDLTIQTGNLIFGNNACVLGQSFTDSFFINDASDRTILYVDNTGLHAVEYWIKNSTYDTNFSNALKRIGDLETNLATETANRGNAINNLSNTINNHVLYVTLDVAKTTAKFSESAIGVTGVLNIANGGTGHNSWTKNRIVYASETNALNQLDAGANDDVLMSGGSTGAPFWHTPTTTNTNNAIVRRDGQGGFSAGTITANLSGNATSADKVNKVLKLNNKTFDGSTEVDIGTIGVGYGGTGTSTAPVKGGIIYGASTSKYACTVKGTTGDVLMSGGESTPYWHTPASTNTKNALVLRDGNGDFSAGTITLDTRNPAIKFSATEANYIFAPAESSINLCVADSVALASSALCVTATAVKPGKTNTFTLGTDKILWSNVYATTFTGAMSQSISINNKSYNGSAAVDVGTIGVGYGGTGKTSWTAGRIIYASATNTLAQLSAGTSGQYLRSKGSSAPEWSSTIVVQVNPSTAPTEAGAIWITT